ncbi:MAG: hypothetical protein OXI10_02195, partial [Gammaproteobacteria bacterium]|nr:hypothetical protein [Gammaproteobacteria bacterium]
MTTTEWQTRRTNCQRMMVAGTVPVTAFVLTAGVRRQSGSENPPGFSRNREPNVTGHSGALFLSAPSMVT